MTYGGSIWPNTLRRDIYNMTQGDIYNLVYTSNKIQTASRLCNFQTFMGALILVLTGLEGEMLLTAAPRGPGFPGSP